MMSMGTGHHLSAPRSRAWLKVIQEEQRGSPWRAKGENFGRCDDIPFNQYLLSTYMVHRRNVLCVGSRRGEALASGCNLDSVDLLLRDTQQFIV